MNFYKRGGEIMDKSKMIVNGIFYLVLTTLFLILWIKEKEVVAVIRGYRDAFSNKLINIFNLKNQGGQTALRKTVNFVETIGSALILVLVIQKFYLGNFLVPTGSMIPTIIPRDRLFGNMVIYKFKKPELEDIIVFKEPVENKVLYTKRLMGEPGDIVKIDYGHLYINGVKIEEREYSNLGELGYNTWIVPKKGDIVKIIPGANYSTEFKSEDIAKIQSELLKAPAAISEILPDVEFYINGKRTGMLLDYIHNEKVVTELLNGRTYEGDVEEDYYLALGDNTNGSYDSRMWGFVAESRIKGKAFVRFWPLNRIGLLK